jgi:hypothetical protein
MRNVVQDVGERREFCRNGGIRTRDPYHPKVVR